MNEMNPSNRTIPNKQKYAISTVLTHARPSSDFLLYLGSVSFIISLQNTDLERYE